MKLIAEPWDIGPGGYQVGRFPPGWAEWNDKFRDTVRAYWRGDEGKVPDLARRLTASGDEFNHRGRKPWASVNFITAHDGFSLNDLVSYNDKHSEANGEDNRDGHSNNLSWNCGAEGETDDANIRTLRERQKRNLLATLLFSQGTPMLLAGDEFGNTQNGNNNAYCQDSEMAWLDWEDESEERVSLTRFVKRCIELRHKYPVLRRSRFFTGVHNKELDVKDVTWVDPRGQEKTQESWSDPGERCFGMVLDGRAQPTGIVRPGSDATLLLILNAYHDVVDFTLPTVPGGSHWRCLIDTNIPERPDEPRFSSGDVYQVTGRSLLMFVLENGSRA